LLTLCTCTRSRLKETVALTADHAAVLTVALLLVVAVVVLHLVLVPDLLVVLLVVTVTMKTAVVVLHPVNALLLVNVIARNAMENEALVVNAVLAVAEVQLRKPFLIVADPDLLLLVKRKAISGKIHTFLK
jgi:hypothetical protein